MYLEFVANLHTIWVREPNSTALGQMKLSNVHASSIGGYKER